MAETIFDAAAGSVQESFDEQMANLFGTTKWADWTNISTYESGESWNGSYYTKIGKITYLQISIKGLTPNSQTQIFTLPTGYKPLFGIEFDGFGGAAYLNHAHFKVADSGAVFVYSADAYATGFISFPSL